MAGLIISITFLATASIVPYATAGLVDLDCTSRTSGPTLMLCRGGQPANGDIISVKIKSTGTLCTATLSFVTGYDTPKDRVGTAKVTYFATCDGVNSVASIPIIIIDRF